jgi:hypothetical protein
MEDFSGSMLVENEVQLGHIRRDWPGVFGK